MLISSVADVCSLAREYLCWADRAGALSDEELDQVAFEAAGRWWDQHGPGRFDWEEISELYEIVHDELLKLAPDLR